MPIQWGGTTGHMQVGIDVRYDAYDTNTTAINVYVDFWVRTIAWGAADNQTLTAYVNGGAWSTWNYHLSSPSGATTAQVVGTVTIASQGLSYGGGPSYTFQGSVSGSALGPNPSHAIGWTLPARPANVPTAPGTSADSVTSSSARVVVRAADGRGAGVDAYRVRVQRTADGAIVFDQQTGGTVTVGGLARATRYSYFAGAHNAVGWGPWSAARDFTTAATAPDAPTAAPRSTAVAPDSLGFSWTAPVNGGSAITTYDLQVSTSAAFSTASTVSTTALSATATGLAPATLHYARVRARNAVGVGAWSPVARVETLSSAKVRVDGAWRLARVWVRTSTAWVQAKAWKRHPDGSWRL
ncbi:fibronectin type III domain-containing protein [Cellulomonas sp. C5510]|uniref:fibronectin type III domain-containing protein n=1 Tax=Cellulomonas sp. C5510 TaxID=2871170 RepID=UPI001C969584|nr:fibronectin type III domain-containing protein [Cellulomonas sp. C5510]QZN86603.1 fibronectin type III domain-containing protein [Cellulomonas sp. C5510]